MGCDMDKQLNPDMPAQQLRLHMGELTANEMCVARAAIRWANTKSFEWQRAQDALPPEPRRDYEHVGE